MALNTGSALTGQNHLAWELKIPAFEVNQQVWYTPQMGNTPLPCVVVVVHQDNQGGEACYTVATLDGTKEYQTVLQKLMGYLKIPLRPQEESHHPTLIGLSQELEQHEATWR